MNFSSNDLQNQMPWESVIGNVLPAKKKMKLVWKQKGDGSERQKLALETYCGLAPESLS